MTAHDPRDVLRAHAAAALAPPKPPTPAELSELRSYAIAVAALAAKADRLAPALPGHEWRCRGAAAELAKLQAEAWLTLTQMERLKIPARAGSRGTHERGI